MNNTDARTSSKAPSPAVVLATLFAAVGLLYPFGLAVVQRLLLLTYHLDNAAAWQATSLVAKSVAVQWGVKILFAGNTIVIALAYGAILLLAWLFKLTDVWASKPQSDTDVWTSKPQSDMAPIVRWITKSNLSPEKKLRAANAANKIKTSRWMAIGERIGDGIFSLMLYPLVLVIALIVKPSGADVYGLAFLLAPALACAGLYAVIRDTNNSQGLRSRLSSWTVWGLMLFYAAALVSDYASLSGKDANIFPQVTYRIHGQRQQSAWLLNHADGYWYVVIPEQTAKRKRKQIVIQRSQVLPIRDATLDYFAIVSTINTSGS